MDPRILQNALGKIRQVAQRIQTLPDQVTAARQLTEQNLTPKLNEYAQNIVNKIPAPVLRQALPVVPPNISRQVLSLGGSALSQQPESYLRGADYLINPTRRAEVSRMDLMGKLQAGGDVLNFVPMGSLLKGAGKTAQALDITQSGLGQMGKIKLGPGVKAVDEVASNADEGITKLTHLLNYPNELLKRGYKKRQIDLIGSKEAKELIEQGISPDQWADRKLMPWMTKPKTKSVMPKAPEPAIHSSLDGAKEAFENWVNTRRATPIQGLIAKRGFQDLDSKGIEGIFEFQAGNKAGRFGDVKQYFDDKYTQLQRSGVNFNYEKDYLPGLWNNTKKEIEAVFGRRLTQRPGFAMEKVIKDYEEGIAKGLTPKFNQISDLVGWYEGRANKVLADRDFFEFLSKKGFIVPDDAAPRNFVTLDPDKFPKITVKIKGQTYSGNYKAEPELAKRINNYLKDPDGPLQGFAEFASRVKNLGLAGGIPGTAINYHGVVNIFRRDLLSSNNPIKTFLRDGLWMLHPNSADTYVQKNLADANFFAKHGLTITSEDWLMDKKILREGMIGGKVAKVEDLYEKWFGDPLFKKVLPAIKIEFAKTQYKDLIKTMPEDEAAKKASELANTVFGGINLDSLGRSKDTQNFLRSVILAPDWAESTLRIGKGLYLGLRHPFTPEYKVYRNIARNLVVFYVAENVLNKVLSGHWMFENEGGINKTKLDTGTYTDDGKKRYMTPWGTAQDFVRIPYEIVAKMADGKFGQALADPLVNRFSMPLSMASHLLTNQDYLHRPIYGNDRYGNPIPQHEQIGNVFNQLAQGFGAPVQLRALIDYMSGKSTGEEAISQALEAPLRYSGGSYSKSQKTVASIAKGEGATGEDIYNLNNRMQGVSLTDKQAETLRQGGLKLLDPIMALKDARSAQYKVRQIQEQIMNGELSREEGETKIEELMKNAGKAKVKEAASGIESTHASGFPSASIVAAGSETEDTLQSQLEVTLAKTRVKATGQPEIVGGKYYYLDGTSVKSIVLNRTIEEPKYTGNEDLDKQLKSSYEGQLTSKINDITSQYKQGLISGEEANNQIARLKAFKTKTKKSSAKTAKSPKAKKIKVPTLKKVSAKASGKVKLKRVRLPKIDIESINTKRKGAI